MSRTPKPSRSKWWVREPIAAVNPEAKPVELLLYYVNLETKGWEQKLLTEEETTMLLLQGYLLRKDKPRLVNVLDSQPGPVKTAS